MKKIMISIMAGFLCMVPASLSAKDFKGSHDTFFPNTYGLGRYGGRLFNIINSISPRYWNNWGVMIKVNF